MMNKFSFACLLLAFSASLQAEEETKKEAKTAGPLYGPVVVSEIEKGAFNIVFDATYWVGKVQGLVYSTVGVSTEEALVPTPTATARPGFRFGLGFEIDVMKAEFAIDYTWFKNTRPRDKYKHYNLSGAGNYYGSGFQKVGGSFSNDFNSFDVLLKKRYIFDQGISLQPYGGLIANWSDQWFSALASNAITGPEATHDLYIVDNIWGVGPIAGINTSFFVPESLMAKYRFGLLADGGFALSYNRTSSQSDVYSDNVISSISKRLEYELIPMIKGALGLTWEYLGGKDHPWSIGIYLKWDTQTWVGYSYLHENTISNGGLNYSMQGATLGMQGSF